MKITPVIDLKEGRVVRGSEGDRENYKPVESNIVEKSDPMKVLEAFEENYSFSYLYVADIDSLEDQGSNWDQIQKLMRKTSVIVDEGFTSIEESGTNHISEVDKYVVPTETLKSLTDLKKLISKFGPSKIVVSVDIDERCLKNNLGFDKPYRLLEKLEKIGVEQLIVLDISSVGTESGMSRFIEKILDKKSSDFDIISGGGVRDREDYKQFIDKGVRSVLVSTALHKKGL